MISNNVSRRASKVSQMKNAQHVSTNSTWTLHCINVELKLNRSFKPGFSMGLVWSKIIKHQIWNEPFYSGSNANPTSQFLKVYMRLGWDPVSTYFHLFLPRSVWFPYKNLRHFVQCPLRNVDYAHFAVQLYNPEFPQTKVPSQYSFLCNDQIRYRRLNLRLRIFWYQTGNCSTKMEGLKQKVIINY